MTDLTGGIGIHNRLDGISWTQLKKIQDGRSKLVLMKSLGLYSQTVGPIGLILIRIVNKFQLQNIGRFILSAYDRRM